MPEKCYDEQEIDQARRHAFLATVLATLALVTSSIFLPVACGMLQRLNSRTNDELSFCRSTSRNLQNEFVRIATFVTPVETPKSKREWLFGQWVVQKPGYTDTFQVRNSVKVQQPAAVCKF